MAVGSPQDMCSIGCKPLEYFTPNARSRCAPPMGGPLKTHFGQEEGTEADLESEARLGRALDHFQA